MDTSKKSGLDSLGNVDQIRELLFGTQLRELTTSIEQLNNKFEALQTSVETAALSMKEELNKRIEEDLSNMQKRLKQSTSQLKEEITDANEQAIKLERRIQSAADTRTQEIEDTIEANKAASQRLINDLKNEFIKMQENIKNQLSSIVTESNDKQLSKEMMSEMLMNMAMQVKGIALKIDEEENQA